MPHIGRDDRRLRSRFGVRALGEPQWAADDWHPSYVGAPRDSSPWMDGDAIGVHRGGFFLAAMQSDEEILDALAARREPGPTQCRVRLARDA